MYLPPWDVAKYAASPQERPLILCEYAYSRGNSTGDLWSYWRTFYEGKNAQGGFIWDFQDRAIPQPIDPDRNGRVLPVDAGRPIFWAYGGDFGPPGTPSDGNMCCNGIVGTDRVPHPAAYEVKHIYQPVHARAVDLAARTVELRSSSTFTDLKDLSTGWWMVTAEGSEVASGPIGPVDLGPRETRTLSIPVKPFAPEPGVEYWLELSFVLSRRVPWASPGYEIAWDQFALPDAAPRPVLALSAMPPLRLEREGSRAVVSGKGFAAAFDAGTGALCSLRSAATERIAAPLGPHFWRAPTDIDRGYDMPKVHAPWKTAADEMRAEQVSIEETAGGRAVRVRSRARLPRVDAIWETAYTVYGSGDIVVDARFAPDRRDLPPLPRLGMRMDVPGGFEAVRWYGRGPHETYDDRKDARVRTYAGYVDGQAVDYTRPSEMGNKVDVRWISLRNGAGIGLLAAGMPALSACALHYATEDLDGPRHLHEVKRRETIELHLDHRQMGVGGDNGWGARPHEAFTIRCEPRSYRFRLRPLAASDDPATLARLAIEGEPPSATGR
jgi:beta-galactosidase